MGLFDFFKSTFNSLFKRLSSVKKYDDTTILAVLCQMPSSLEGQYGDPIKKLADEIHQVYRTANNKEFTIGVIGDYSVGKSSFINAILGTRILPVSVNPSTAIITKIKYGQDTRAVVKFSDGTERQMTYEEYMLYSAFNNDDFNERQTTGTVSRFANVVGADLYVKSSFLKNNNLCIVDTLGLSAADNDNKKTIDSIHDSVVMVYVCGERGLTQHDQKFISDYLGHVIIDSVVCINRIDLVRHEELEQLTHNVKLKLDSAIRAAGADGKFPEERIYQVSSLYQEFANGFTDHNDWRKGVDYSTHSGFMPMMKDLAQYIGERAELLREKAIVKKLDDACKKLEMLREIRKSEIQARINAIWTNISDIEREKKKREEKKAYIDTLFEGLEQTIYSFLPNIYPDFTKEVNDRWEGNLKSELLNATDFGVGDYLSLEKNVLSVKMKVFSSDKDALYAKLEVASRFAKPTIAFFQKILGEIISQVDSRIEHTINEFVERNSYSGLYNECITLVSSCLKDRIVVGNNPAVFNPMCRAAALAGIESTWLKSKTRKTVMFNATKREGLKAVENPLNELLKNIHTNIIQRNLEIFNHDITKDLKKEIADLEAQTEALQSSIVALHRQLKAEETYFSNVCSTLKKTYD